MAQICEPSSEASSDCAGCLAKGSLPAVRHVAPLSSEISTPPVVAANHALLVKRRSFTWNASGCEVPVFAFGAGRFAAAAPALPLVTGCETGFAAASATYKPDLTHLFVASS